MAKVLGNGIGGMQVPAGIKSQGTLIIIGWLVLVTVIVLIVLFQLGFGNPAKIVGPTCVTQPGFVCSAPSMNTTGMVKVQFGQIVYSQIVITGVGCSKNLTGFTNTSATYVVVNSGQTTTLEFPCPQPAAVGNVFSGYLWITYDAGTSTGLLMQFGKVITSVTAPSDFIVYSDHTATVTHTINQDGAMMW
ncbi:MAG: hypothetical protein KGH66_02535 [Candidatus Micrarchaeota archaeon]|nr:hypothetical protein [Candidatus Micrarchaeota archaeon]